MLKDPGTVLELIFVMDFSVVWDSIDARFVNDFQQTVTELT